MISVSSALLLPIAAAGVVACAIGGRRLWNASAAAIFCLGFGALLFAGNWQYVPVVASLPLKPDRLLIALAIAMLIVRSPAERDRPRFRAEPVHLALAAAATYGVLAFAWGRRSSADLFSIVDAFGLMPFAAFVVAPVAFRTPQRRSLLLATLVGVGAYLGATAVFESMNLTQLVWPRYISDPNVGTFIERARGPFVQPAANGLALFGSCVAAAIGLRIWTDRRHRAFALVVLVLCFIGCVLTLTRAVWIATVVGALGGLLVDRSTRRLVVPLMVGGAIAVALAFAVVPGLTAKADARGSDLRPVWDRLNTNAAALRMLEDRPALGFGWGSFEQGSLPYLRQADRYPLTGYGIPVHNVLLGNAVALGAVGMAVWLTAWCWALMGPLRRFGSRFPELDAWRAGLVALILHWLVVSLFTPVAYPLPIMLLWVWAGIVWGLRQDPGLRLASRHDRSGMTADVSLQPVTAL